MKNVGKRNEFFINNNYYFFLINIKYLKLFIINIFVIIQNIIILYIFIYKKL